MPNESQSEPALEDLLKAYTLAAEKVENAQYTERHTSSQHTAAVNTLHAARVQEREAWDAVIAYRKKKGLAAS